MTEGLSDLLGNIKKLQANNRSQGIKAVKKAGEHTQKILREETPKSSGNLASDTTQSGLRGSGQGEIEIDIGFGKAEGWRAHFPDSGTIYQRAQNFSEKTVERARPGVIEIYEDHIRKGLDI